MVLTKLAGELNVSPKIVEAWYHQERLRLQQLVANNHLKQLYSNSVAGLPGATSEQSATVMFNIYYQVGFSQDRPKYLLGCYTRA